MRRRRISPASDRKVASTLHRQGRAIYCLDIDPELAGNGFPADMSQQSAPVDVPSYRETHAHLGRGKSAIEYDAVVPVESLFSRERRHRESPLSEVAGGTPEDLSRHRWATAEQLRWPAIP